jgi:hypothetical protein
VLVGRAEDVPAALRDLDETAHVAGLQLEPSKCELVLTASSASSVVPGMLPANFVLRGTGEFELLGAPVGEDGFCNTYTIRERVAKAEVCLDALADSDPQAALFFLLLLRDCGSYSNLVHSTRVMPPSAHALALRAFDELPGAKPASTLRGPGPAQFGFV